MVDTPALEAGARNGRASSTLASGTIYNVFLVHKLVKSSWPSNVGHHARKAVYAGVV